MTDKEIRNKMYSLFSDFVRKYEKDFKMSNKERAPIKEIMEEYRLSFGLKLNKVELKTEGKWKSYPESE
jgi:hypothetical protein